MLKISIVEGSNQRRLVLEGRLTAPWTEELKTVYQKATAELEGRELVIDLINLTTISQQGENLLLEFMEQGVRLRGCGVFTKEILKHVARRLHAKGAHS
jgi:anti-anti-sigma regulatory factor